MWSQQAAFYSDFYQQHHSQHSQLQHDARISQGHVSPPPYTHPGDWYTANSLLQSAQPPPYPYDSVRSSTGADSLVHHTAPAADSMLERSPSKLVMKTELTPPKSEPGDDKPFGCMYPKCNYVTNRRNNLKRHHATMHERLNSPHYCCGNTYVRKADLRIHNKECHKEGYVCNWPNCGKSFLRKALMDRHMKIHTGEKPFICSICRYGTSHKSNLDRHVKIHAKSAMMNNECKMYGMYESYKLNMQHSQDSEVQTGNCMMWGGGSFMSPEKSGQFSQVCAADSLSSGSGCPESILPDSTTTELSPSQLSGPARNLDGLDPRYIHNYIEQLIPQAADKILSSMSGGVGSGGFPACDLSTISSILMSPLKGEADRETVDRWIRGVESGRDDFTICRDLNKVSHTIENILGSN